MKADHVRTIPLALLAALLVGSPAHSEEAPKAESAADRPAVQLTMTQEDLDEDERLAAPLLEVVAEVLKENRVLLGAPAIEFCRRMSNNQRIFCLGDMKSRKNVGIPGPVEVIENSELTEGGKDWPNADDVSDFRRIRLRVLLSKGKRVTWHEANVVIFTSKDGDADETCVFPLEQWTWSEMDRPERFRQAPVGFCDGKKSTFGAYLAERRPEATAEVLRFLSKPEAEAWVSGDPEKIKWDSPYTTGHPYAKFFLLDSTRWWRGGNAGPRRDGYAWAVRFPALSLKKMVDLEASGELFLDIFEEGAQVELTNVTKDGLVALLAENPEVLVDTSEPDATQPRFEPFEPTD